MYNKEYYWKHREKCIQYQIEWNKKHPEQFNKWRDDYYYSEKGQNTTKEYYNNNKERKLEYGKEWRDKHPNYQKEYYDKNKEKRRLWQIEYRRKKREADKAKGNGNV